ncbi:hypothetical protein V2G26_016569 [Clonostachys chloroleuca]
MDGILVATSALGKAGRISIVGIVHDTHGDRQVLARCSSTIGSSDNQNTYTGDLEAIATALRRLPDGLRHLNKTVMASSRSALQVIALPQGSVPCKAGRTARTTRQHGQDAMGPFGRRLSHGERKAKVEAQRAARGASEPRIKPPFST